MLFFLPLTWGGCLSQSEKKGEKMFETCDGKSIRIALTGKKDYIVLDYIVWRVDGAGDSDTINLCFTFFFREKSQQYEIRHWWIWHCWIIKTKGRRGIQDRKNCQRRSCCNRIEPVGTPHPPPPFVEGPNEIVKHWAGSCSGGGDAIVVCWHKCIIFKWQRFSIF